MQENILSQYISDGQQWNTYDSMRYVLQKQVYWSFTFKCIKWEVNWYKYNSKFGKMKEP